MLKTIVATLWMTAGCQITVSSTEVQLSSRVQLATVVVVVVVVEE